MPLDKSTAHKEPEKVRKRAKLKRFALPHTTNSVAVPPMPNLDCQVLFHQFLFALIKSGLLGVSQTDSSMYCIFCLILS
ncbi:hypothetical protein BCR42DRAFT_400566 [Absidia repens]|uniref:Uncharacterized protein n=1 Tax=Absidia repens TaxID=90262 RepID=A0A1X2J1D3_9FUNG|nr:hypothetical protein BCR42DRAFT_400566 [Absidia repens]